jgi:hypothetical protein
MNDLTSDLDEDEDTGVSFHAVYPNPARQNLNVTFSLAKMTPITLSIYDLLGRPVSSIFTGRLPEGKHSITTSVEGLIEGVYFCQIVTDRGASMHKFRIVHG